MSKSKITKKFLIILAFFLLLSGSTYFAALNFRTAAAGKFQLDEQAATIMAIKKTMPAVVSIIVYDEESVVTYNVDTGDQTSEKQKVEKGEGTGFLISSDGLILTNKHVVEAADNESTAQYRVILNSGKQYYAQLIGKDPINDLAVIKIFDKNLPYVNLGDSDKLQIGTTVIAIGNALGRYQNSATKGIVSGLGRSIYASDQVGNAESLDNVIQTDAQINLGNSGGPLINLDGNVVGINVAMDESGSSIGFAIPINDAKPVITSVKQSGMIIRPRLGISYVMITPELVQDKNLPRSNGALISSDGTNPAVTPDSPADKAGLEEGDIIFEINGIKLEGKNTLLSVVQKYKPGDKIGLKVQRGNKVFIRTVVLDQFK